MISPEEYLSMSFGEREPEYVRGELIYKPMPDAIHGYVHAVLTTMLATLLRPLGYRTLLETRSRLAYENFRLPDIAVFAPGQPFKVLPTEPPLITIEIISKDQKYSEMLQKLEDYRAWGVKHIWTVDPRRKRLAILEQNGQKEVDALALPGTDFRVTIDELLQDVPPEALQG